MTAHAIKLVDRWCTTSLGWCANTTCDRHYGWLRPQFAAAAARMPTQRAAEAVAFSFSKPVLHSVRCYPKTSFMLRVVLCAVGWLYCLSQTMVRAAAVLCTAFVCRFAASTETRQQASQEENLSCGSHLSIYGI